MFKQTVALVLVLGITGAFGQSRCENSTLPDGNNCPSTGLHLYPDEEHCSMYWECYNGCLTHMLCQLNFLYDINNKWCDFPQNVKCGDRDCDDRPCNDEDDGADFDCPKPNGFFEDPKNCAYFYQCYEDIATHQKCNKQDNTQLLYRQSDNQCDWPDRVECGERPVCDDNDENCHDNHISTPKPNACNNADFECVNGDGNYAEGSCERCFCVCYGNGAGHEETCCPQGLVYNSANGLCDYPVNVNGC